MFLKNMTISGFRSFGIEPTTIDLSESITTLVGPNAAGKTAVLQGLAKLFGISKQQREVQKSDFHLGPNDNPDNQDTKNLFIDVLIALPELVNGTAESESIAPFFDHMQIQDNHSNPVCRIRLEAQWKSDGTIDGEIEQRVVWVHTPDSDPGEDDKQRALPVDRGRIQLYYAPASRDAGNLTRAAAGILTKRLLNAIEWSSETKEAVCNASEVIKNALDGEEALVVINKFLQQRWLELCDKTVGTNLQFSLTSPRFEEIVRQIAIMIGQELGWRERSLDELSDGQQSLLYFAIASAVFDIEREIVSGKAGGFRSDRLSIPALSIFAIEEPENHLSPYYLSRIIRQVYSLTETGRAQSIMTSHSSAILSRVNPCDVRYCRLCTESCTSSVNSIKIPTKSDEAGKFVRGAMLAYPELYFARFVLLVEGDSERIVLPHIAKAVDMHIDPSFVAIVPLGGRHVNYFWDLLFHLQIPYATLLDLDLGRAGGGFGRIKETIRKLIDFSSIEGGALWNDEDINNIKNMATRENPEDIEKLQKWLDCLEQRGVFFSEPLDLDLTMLKYFFSAYKKIIPSKGGPRKGDSAARAVFGPRGPGLKLYKEKYRDYTSLFPSYRYHFITHSKPATHLEALTHIDIEDLNESTIPPVLFRVVAYITSTLEQI